MLPGEQKQIKCCSYTVAQGSPTRWECPGCHRIWNPDAPPPTSDASVKT